MRRGLMIAGFLGLMIGGIFAEEIWAAEKYPVKPIEFIVSVEAGADGDRLTVR